jgi:hypothetical protein
VTADQPYIANPEAIGDPDQMPVLVIPQGPDGDSLRAAIAINTRNWLRSECAACGRRREDGHVNDHAFGEMADHEFVEKSVADQLTDRLADITTTDREGSA